MSDEGIVVPAEHQLGRIRKLFQAEIIGVMANRAVHTESETRQRAFPYLPRDADGLTYSAIWRASYSPAGILQGGVYMHVPYDELLEMMSREGEEDFVRGLGRTRRTLASIAVVEDSRRTGLGTRLLRAAEDEARSQGALWVTGFMDERNGSPDFYRTNGYQILARNRPLPELEPFPVREYHPRYVNGQWFYKKL